MFDADPVVVAAELVGAAVVVVVGAVVVVVVDVLVVVVEVLVVVVDVLVVVVGAAVVVVVGAAVVVVDEGPARVVVVAAPGSGTSVTGVAMPCSTPSALDDRPSASLSMAPSDAMTNRDARRPYSTRVAPRWRRVLYAGGRHATSCSSTRWPPT
jgi:hypothetical protein